MLKVGDKVRMDLESIIKYIGHKPYWYNYKTYTIIETEYCLAKNNVKLDSIISNDKRSICCLYLKLDISTERKRKLETIMKMYEI